MCSQYTLKTSAQELSSYYGILAVSEVEINSRVLPYTAAVVVREIQKKNQFEKMNYSLVPSWSKESKVKFATHNARIETILEKPTWKKPFVTKRCLVPISEFIESIYTEKWAGNLVRFSDVHGHFLTAAGIWDEWIDPQTKKTTHSFSIITDEPPEFVEKSGHDRCPVFLKKQAFSSWLDLENTDPIALIKILKTEKENVHLKVEIDRPLKAGWEKRI